MSALYGLFSNIFYAGAFKYKGAVYTGKHKPMITLEEFARAQSILGRPDRPRPSRKSFSSTGLIRCGCGLSITAEDKVNRFGSRYSYYHCTRRHPDGYCRQPSVQPDHLERSIAAAIDRIALAPAAKEWLLERISRFEATKTAERDQGRESLEKRIVAIEAELRTLTNLRLRDLINDEEFARSRTELDQQRLTLVKRRDSVAKSHDWIEPAREVIKFSNEAANYFLHARRDVKRMIFETVGSNPILKDKILSIEARKPFRMRQENTSVSSMCTFLNEVRTLWNTQDDEYLSTLAQIRRIEAELKNDSSMKPAA